MAIYPVHIACRARASISVIQNLLENYTDSVHSTGGRGDLPVQVAARSGAPIEVMKMLIEHNPGSVRLRDSNGDLPIHAACRNGAVVPFQTIQFLVDQDPATLHIPGGKGTVADPLCLLCSVPLFESSRCS